MTASWYGEPFHGRLTASGERYDMHALTAAHPSLPFGTRLLVTSAKTGRSTTVTVTDRGPFVPGRQLDLSLAAAHAVGLVPDGVGRLRVEVLDRDLRYRQRVVDTTAGPTPGPFAIQFGAFAERDHAVQLTLALASPRIAVEEAVVDGVRYYRVRMGPFASRAEAVKRAAAYAEEGYRPWVVQR
ncbi:MAG: septal ring lytic transglycosylase RlpA family protein [Nitrospiria bacterium]